MQRALSIKAAVEEAVRGVVPSDGYGGSDNGAEDEGGGGGDDDDESVGAEAVGVAREEERMPEWGGVRGGRRRDAQVFPDEVIAKVGGVLERVPDNAVRAFRTEKTKMQP